MSKKKKTHHWRRKDYDAITIPIPINEITVPPDRLRALNKETVASLVASFREIKLQHPITVRLQDKKWILIAGWHRLEAAKRCGWKTIMAMPKTDVDDDHAKLMEIDENLARAELSPAERALHIDKRKKLYEKLHPQTKHGGNRKSPGEKSSRQNGNLKRFTEDTAGKTGQSERSVQRDAARGENVKVLPDIVGTSLDKGAELDALAELPEAEQCELAKRAKSGEKVSAKPVDLTDGPIMSSVYRSAEKDIEQHRGEMAELALTPEEKAAKASAQSLAEFTVACHAWLPKVTIEADRQKARLLVSELTKSKPKAKAA